MDGRSPLAVNHVNTTVVMFGEHGFFFSFPREKLFQKGGISSETVDEKHSVLNFNSLYVQKQLHPLNTEVRKKMQS